MLATCLYHSVTHLSDCRDGHVGDKNAMHIKPQTLAKSCSSLKPKSNQYLSLQQHQFSSVLLAGELFQESSVSLGCLSVFCLILNIMESDPRLCNAAIGAKPPVAGLK